MADVDDGWSTFMRARLTRRGYLVQVVLAVSALLALVVTGFLTVAVFVQGAEASTAWFAVSLVTTAVLFAAVTIVASVNWGRAILRAQQSHDREQPADSESL